MGNGKSWKWAMGKWVSCYWPEEHKLEFHITYTTPCTKTYAINIVCQGHWAKSGIFWAWSKTLP